MSTKGDFIYFDGSSDQPITYDDLQRILRELENDHPELAEMERSCSCGSWWCHHNNLTGEERHILTAIDNLRWLLS